MSDYTSFAISKSTAEDGYFAWTLHAPRDIDNLYLRNWPNVPIQKNKINPNPSDSFFMLEFHSLDALESRLAYILVDANVANYIAETVNMDDYVRDFTCTAVDSDGKPVSVGAMFVAILESAGVLSVSEDGASLAVNQACRTHQEISCKLKALYDRSSMTAEQFLQSAIYGKCMK